MSVTPIKEGVLLRNLAQHIWETYRQRVTQGARCMILCGSHVQACAIADRFGQCPPGLSICHDTRFANLPEAEWAILAYNMSETAYLAFSYLRPRARIIDVRSNVARYGLPRGSILRPYVSPA